MSFQINAVSRFTADSIAPTDDSTALLCSRLDNRFFTYRAECPTITLLPISGMLPLANNRSLITCHSPLDASGHLDHYVLAYTK
jgi:hypothetical protein